MLLDRSRNTYILSLNVKWMSGEAAKSTKTKLKQLVFESITPVEERDRQSLTDDFLQDEDNLSEKEEDFDEVDFRNRR